MNVISILMIVTLPFLCCVAAAEDGTDTVAMVDPFHPRAITLGNAANYSPPDFMGYPTIKQRKRAFFDYLLPKIKAANEEVLKERNWLLTLSLRLERGLELTESDRAALRKAAHRYFPQRPNVEHPPELVNALLDRVDMVPVSLVLAQAVKESAWGTSRFAREGNNLFGIWCFYKGCGITPQRRLAGRNHEVAEFDTVDEGVRYYLRLINSHWAYEEVRKIRARLRRQGRALAGEALATGLQLYSERGNAYVEEVKDLIRHNELYRFTREAGD